MALAQDFLQAKELQIGNNRQTFRGQTPSSFTRIVRVHNMAYFIEQDPFRICSTVE